MAEKNYLISGLPGTGKTSVCMELQARGYRAIDADRNFAYQSGDDWLWDDEKIEKALDNPSDKIAFVCGSASNREKYEHKFSRVFILCIDDLTLKHRLINRTNNNFGKKPEILARQINRNQGIKEYSIKRGRTVIDATQSLEEVVDEIISLIH